MSPPGSTLAPVPIRPPRPNLGPEPWPESSIPWGPIGITAVALLAALAVGRWLRRVSGLGRAFTFAVALRHFRFGSDFFQHRVLL